MKPLFCNDSTTIDALLCRIALEAPSTATGEIMFMPAGVYEITPSQGGKCVTVQVLVSREAAAAMEAQRAALVAKGKRPYFDLNHDDDRASFWPDKFYWKDAGDRSGIYASGEYSKSGREAVEGKDYRQFSPVFYVDDVRAKPARIVCREDAKPNMGGFVNDPAFHKILPMWAKAAGALPAHADAVIKTMTPEELAALQAKNKELQSEIETLKGEQSALKAKNESDALVASKITARENELKANAAQLEVESLKAKNKTQADAITARNKADSEAEVKAAVTRGAIAAKDEATQTSLIAKATEDPSFLSVIKAMQGNAALGLRVLPPAGGSSVSVTRQAGIDTVRAYAAVVAKNAAIKDVGSRDKSKLASEAAAIFAADMKGKEDDWMGVALDEALKAADVTSASIGTLAGTLVLQRNLPLLKYSYPVLQTLFTDFSDTPGLWQQTEVTRIPIAPAVTEYDATTDTNGRPKGFVVVTPAQSVDVSIQLSKHVGIPMIFGVQTLASTIRNLFAEQAAGAINALGGYFVDMATALMTAGNFNAYAGPTTDASCVTVSGSTAITLTSTAGVYPGQEISGAGIPTGAHIASVTDSTHAVMTLAATASATVTATFNGGKVPALYATYAKALADFNFASLGELGTAFDNNRIPYEGRAALLNASYYQRLAQDPTFNTFFAAMNNQAIISRGELPQLNNFTPQKAPWFPTSANRVGFAYHKAAIALKSRLPQDFTQAVSAVVPGNITTVTDPDTGISVLHVERVDVVGRYAESSIEVMLGANVGDRRAGLVLTSQ